MTIYSLNCHEKWPPPPDGADFFDYISHCHSEATCHYSGLDLHQSFCAAASGRQRGTGEGSGKRIPVENSSSLLETTFWHLTSQLRSNWLKLCWANSATCLQHLRVGLAALAGSVIPCTRSYNTMTGRHPWCWVKLQFVSREMRINLSLIPICRK